MHDPAIPRWNRSTQDWYRA